MYPAMVMTVSNGAWICQMSNSNKILSFKGSTLDEQAASLQMFAQKMQEGGSQAVLNANQLFNETGAADTMQEFLFAGKGLAYYDDIIYDIKTAVSLFEECEEAGVALLAVL